MSGVETIDEGRGYAYLHDGILADEDVRGLSDPAFRLWVCSLVKAVSSGSGTISVTVPKKVAAWSGLDISQIEPALDELISSRFLLVPTDGTEEEEDTEGVLSGKDPERAISRSRARHLAIRNFTKYQAPHQDEIGDEPDYPGAPEGPPVDAKGLRTKLHARLDEAEAEMGIAPYTEILEVVLPQALEDYKDLPGLGNGSCLLDVVLFHAGRFYLGGLPDKTTTRQIWYNQIRKMRSEHGAAATLDALEITSNAGVSSLRYVRAVLKKEGGSR